MSTIQFNDETGIENNIHRNKIRSEDTWMTHFLIHKRIVKDDKQASYVLLGVLVFLLAMLFASIYSRVGEVPKVIEGPNGTRYSLEEYVDLVGQGQDPFGADNEN